MISQFKAHRAKSADPLKSINDVRNLILNFPKDPSADIDTPFLVNWHEHQVKNNNVLTGEITLSMTFSSRRMMDNLVNVHKWTSKRGFVFMADGTYKLIKEGYVLYPMGSHIKLTNHRGEFVLSFRPYLFQLRNLNFLSLSIRSVYVF